jgi:hypothetical protein
MVAARRAGMAPASAATTQIISIPIHLRCQIDFHLAFHVELDFFIEFRLSSSPPRKSGATTTIRAT